MSKPYRLMGVEAPFDPDYRFETSWILPPWILFACRALFVSQQTSPESLLQLTETLGSLCLLRAILSTWLWKHASSRTQFQLLH